MAMLGKRFQRTISMSQIGPSPSPPLHAEKAQAHHHHLQLPQEPEHQPANQWEILKQAEAMMMMMMANSGPHSTTDEGPDMRKAFVMSASSEQAHHRQQPPQQQQHHPHGLSSAPEHLLSSPSPLFLPTHNFLDVCFFCKHRLRPERDIFIYRGDAAFCTEECRHRHICDETRSDAASKKATAETAVAA